MVVGQIIVIGQGAAVGNGPATFQVIMISNATNFTGKFLAYPGDILSGTIGTGSSVGPSAILAGNTNLSVAGIPPNAAFSFLITAFGTQAAPLLLNIGTNPPTLTLSSPGTYLLFARARFDYNAFLINSARTITMKLKRTNNTPVDLTFPNGVLAQVNFKTPASGTLTQTFGELTIPPLPYVAGAGLTDIIQLVGYVDLAWTSGTMDVTEASLVAVRIA
jgi:hypothetical protein